MVYVENPLTGYAIKENGPTYNQLREEGWYVDAFRPVRKGYRSPDVSMSPRRRPPGAPARTVSRMGRITARRVGRQEISTSPGCGCGSESRSSPRVARRTTRRTARRSMSPRAGYTKRGKKIGRLPQKSKVMAIPVAKPRPLRETLADLPKSRQAKRRDLEKQLATSKEGRSMRTRGWKAAAPQKGKERHALMEECGEGCFLQPETEGFPICAALREGQGCAIDCRGVTSALVRARQWGYDNVAELAREIQDRKCGREA